MKIIMNRLDVSRIGESINEAKRNGAISRTELKSLLNEIKSAKIVEPPDIPSDVVTMNSKVRIYIKGQNQYTEFQIVYPDKANMGEKKISIFSPLATAIIGNRVSDEIEWKFPSGMTRIRIDEILYQPEAAGNYLL